MYIIDLTSYEKDVYNIDSTSNDDIYIIDSRSNEKDVYINWLNKNNLNINSVIDSACKMSFWLTNILYFYFKRFQESLQKLTNLRGLRFKFPW